MQILTYFQIIPDYTKLTASDWKAALEPSFSYLPPCLSTSDEAALATSLGLKEQNPDASCIAFVIGENHGKMFLHKLGALGYDALLQVEHHYDSTKAQAAQLVDYIKQHGIIDMVMIGQNENSEFACMVTELLGWTFINHVVDVQASPLANHVIITSLQEGKKMTATAALPLVLAMKNTCYYDRLPIPTLHQMDHGKNLPITSLDANQQDITSQNKSCWTLPQTEHDYIASTTQEEQAEQMLHILKSKGLWG